MMMQNFLLWCLIGFAISQMVSGIVTPILFDLWMRPAMWKEPGAMSEPKALALVLVVGVLIVTPIVTVVWWFCS
jgi:hypothetical protein